LFRNLSGAAAGVPYFQIPPTGQGNHQDNRAPLNPKPAPDGMPVGGKSILASRPRIDYIMGHAAQEAEWSDAPSDH